jgi:hypothetical protein
MAGTGVRCLPKSGVRWRTGIWARHSRQLLRIRGLPPACFWLRSGRIFSRCCTRVGLESRGAWLAKGGDTRPRATRADGIALVARQIFPLLEPSLMAVRRLFHVKRRTTPPGERISERLSSASWVVPRWQACGSRGVLRLGSEEKSLTGFTRLAGFFGLCFPATEPQEIPAIESCHCWPKYLALLQRRPKGQGQACNRWDAEGRER